ncbi:MAG: DUF4956 domain-containing protein [Bacteroidales bacterium]|nr:DUF4956 domain-containing protein [Bacteroidales bacterium]
MTNLFVLTQTTFMGLNFFDEADFYMLLARFGFNLGIAFIIIRLIYFPKYKRKDYLFTYLMINTVVFILCFLLDNIKLQLGLALGLFAIFGIIRYRTNPIPIKEMTYLFIVIGLAVVNALANKKISFAEIAFTNFAVLLIVLIMEQFGRLKHESCKLIIYENIELIHPERREELIEDLEKRTGLKISRIDIGRIDFLRDVARILVYYMDNDQHINMADDRDGFTGDNSELG